MSDETSPALQTIGSAAEEDGKTDQPVLINTFESSPENGVP